MSRSLRFLPKNKDGVRVEVSYINRRINTNYIPKEQVVSSSTNNFKSTVSAILKKSIAPHGE